MGVDDFSDEMTAFLLLEFNQLAFITTKIQSSKHAGINKFLVLLYALFFLTKGTLEDKG